MKRLFFFIVFVLIILSCKAQYTGYQTVNVGTTPNSGGGDPLRTAFQKVNSTFVYFKEILDSLNLDSLGGSNVWISGNSYLNSPSSAVIDLYGGTGTKFGTLQDNTEGISLSENNSYGVLEVNPLYLGFQTGSTYPRHWYLFSSSNVWTDNTDTLATRAYARSNGGVGGITMTLYECATCDTTVVAHGSNLAYRIGGSGGEIDSLGNPSTGQVLVWSDPNKAGGTSHITVVGDSVFLPDLDTDYEQWLGITSTGAVFADSLDDASFMLTMSPFPTIEDYMNDLRDGEPLLYYQNDDGFIKKAYGMKEIPKIRWKLQALNAGLEQDKRYIFELTKENQKQEAELVRLRNDIEILKYAVAKLLEDR